MGFTIHLGLVACLAYAAVLFPCGRAQTSDEDSEYQFAMSAEQDLPDPSAVSEFSPSQWGFPEVDVQEDGLLEGGSSPFESQRELGLPVGRGRRELTIKKALSKLFTGLGHLSTVLGLHDWVSNLFSPDRTNQRILEGVQAIQAIVQRTEENVKQLGREIKEEHARTQLSSSETTIRICMNKLTEYARTMTVLSRQQFVGCGADLYKSTQTVFKSLLGQFTVGGDVMQILRNSNKDSRVQFLREVDQFLRVASLGVLLHMVQLKMISESTSTDLEYRRREYSEFERMVKERTKVFEKQYEDESGVWGEMQRLLSEGPEGGHDKGRLSAMADRILNFLTKRYDTKSWIVIVYPPFGGFPLHTFSGKAGQQGFQYVLRNNGYNAMVASFDASKSWDRNGVNSRITKFSNSNGWKRARRSTVSSRSRRFTSLSLPSNARRGQVALHDAQQAFDTLRKDGILPSEPLAVIASKGLVQFRVHYHTPSISENDWREFRGRWFWDSDNLQLNWEDARRFCKQVAGGDLVTLTNREKHEFVNSMFRTDQSPAVAHLRFIGLKADSSRTFKWVDGSRLDYHEFIMGEPNNHLGNEYCGEAVFRTGGSVAQSWNDIPCAGRVQSFVCERRTRFVPRIPAQQRKMIRATEERNGPLVLHFDASHSIWSLNQYVRTDGFTVIVLPP